MRLLFALLIAAATPLALAQNWVGLLKNTPDNQSVTWENPQTKAGGQITVLRSFESKGLPCKEVRVQNQAQGRKGDNKLNKKDGKWRLLSASQLKK